jgi:hypothetical protein
MAKKKVKDFHEPWSASKDTTWETGFKFPPQLSEHIDQDYINKWHATKDKACESAHWFIWGSRLSEPSVSFDYQGRFRVWDGKGIVAFTRNLGHEPGSITHEEVCKRVCDCVNACQGIAGPEKFVTDARALLLAIVKGETDRDDPRFVSLLGRCIPIDELQQSEEEA